MRQVGPSLPAPEAKTRPAAGPSGANGRLRAARPKSRARRIGAAPHLFDPRQIRFARGIILISAAVTGGLHAFGQGYVWQGCCLALGAILYVFLTAAVPSIARALEQDDSPHHMAVTTLDLLFVTAVVWFTGGVRSEYYLLYYGPILYAALRLNIRDGISATILAAVLYLLVVVGHTTTQLVVTTPLLRSLGVFVSAAVLAIFFALIKREAAAYQSLREYLHSSLRRVSAVYDLAHAANAGVGLHSLASMLLDQAMRATGADAGSVSLLSPDGDLQIASTAGLEIDAEQQFAAAVAPSARRALDEGRALLEDLPALVCGLSKALSVALVGPGGPVGALTIASRSSRKLRGTQMESVQVLCSEAAMAIENVQLHAQLNRLASTDHLTGLSNRREMERVLAVEADRAKRYQRPLTLLTLDMDNLKAVNDCYGHAVGDRVLCALGRVLKDSLRTSDATGRMGGDEFLVVLPETGQRGAEAIAARISTKFAAEMQLMQSWREMTAALGLSIGIAAAGEGFVQVEQLMTAADEALYEAKRMGKNRTSAAPLQRQSTFVPQGPPVIY